MTARIAPSILSANFASLSGEICAVEEAGAQLIHIDVMDGHFVPNITIGPPVVDSIRKITGLPLDVHLMITEPDRFVPDFVAAGADILTVHAEAVTHLDRTINFIRSHDVKVGVALNPATALSAVDHILDMVDLVLVMTVNPGFGGQKFIPYTLRKIRRLREIIEQGGYAAEIEVDGGIDVERIAEVVPAGAEILVAGSAIFKSQDSGVAVKEMLEKAATLSYDST